MQDRDQDKENKMKRLNNKYPPSWKKGPRGSSLGVGDDKKSKKSGGGRR